MDFKKERIDCHNYFPKRILFKGELKFKKVLENNNNQIPFLPIKLGYDDDFSYQKCIGHYVDGMGSLPYRPDYMFDGCFRVLDELGKDLFPNKGLVGISQGLGDKLLTHSRVEWDGIIDLLGHHIPLMTCEFLVKSIVEDNTALVNKDKNFTKRVTHCMGDDAYQEFISKFKLDYKKGASFLKLYLSGRIATKVKKNNKFNPLDLTNPKNILSSSKRIEFILSLLLFTMRNERSHGSILSPFMTSRSSIKRYQSYYYAMLSAYIFSLGLFDLNNLGSISGVEIYKCCEQNLILQDSFFS